MPQPNFVPVIFSTSRRVHSNGISSGISRSRGFPFTLSVIMASWRSAGSRPMNEYQYRPLVACLAPVLVHRIRDGGRREDDESHGTTGRFAYPTLKCLERRAHCRDVARHD